MSRTASLSLEDALIADGKLTIVGIDEAGRGAWAGPVAAAAVCLPTDDPTLRERLRGVRDSKQLTAHQRQRLATTICEVALAWGVGWASAEDIDTSGIINATNTAMALALQQVMRSAPTLRPDHLLLDSIDWRDPLAQRLPHSAHVRGDRLSLSIAAASILAKVSRDQWMAEVAEAGYPLYGFAQHKGYGVPRHQVALTTHGACAIHRRTFAPVRAVIDDAARFA